MKKIVISAIMLLALAGTSVFAAQGNKKPATTKTKTKTATSNKMESSTPKTGKTHHRRHHRKSKGKTATKTTKNSKM